VIITNRGVENVISQVFLS